MSNPVEIFIVLSLVVIGLYLLGPSIQRFSFRLEKEEELRLERVRVYSLTRQQEEEQAAERDRIKQLADREMDRLAALRRARSRPEGITSA